jgi:hypothetical protein
MSGKSRWEPTNQPVCKSHDASRKACLECSCRKCILAVQIADFTVLRDAGERSDDLMRLTAYGGYHGVYTVVVAFPNDESKSAQSAPDAVVQYSSAQNPERNYMYHHYYLYAQSGTWTLAAPQISVDCTYSIRTHVLLSAGFWQYDW